MAEHFIEVNFHFKLNILMAFSYCVSCRSSVICSDRRVWVAECSAMFFVGPDQKIMGRKKGEKKNPLCQFLEISAVLKLWSVNTCGERKIYFILDIFALIKHCL